MGHLRGCRIRRPLWTSLHSTVPAAPAYVSIRQHTSAYVSVTCIPQYLQHQHTSEYVSIRQHTSALLAFHSTCSTSIRQHTSALLAFQSISTAQRERAYASIRQHTPAYASIRQHSTVSRQLRERHYLKRNYYGKVVKGITCVTCRFTTAAVKQQ
jgi:hypothetical protein